MRITVHATIENAEGSSAPQVVGHEVLGVSDGLRQGGPAQPALLLAMQRLRLCVGRRRTVSLTGLPLALQIDAGYIKTTRPQADGKRWVPVVASKLVRSSPGRGYAHASALVLGRRQGLRQQAFLQSIGVNRQSPITVLSDGGGDISHACKLPAATARVLDWFLIGMRFEQLLRCCSHCAAFVVRTHTRSIACKAM